MRNENKNKIIIVVVILITFVQSVVLLKFKINKSNDSKSVISVVEKKHLLVKDIDKSLTNLKGYNVVNIKKDVDDWIVNVDIECSKEDLIYDLKSLTNFNIKSYSLNINNDKCGMNLELKSK